MTDIRAKDETNEARAKIKLVAQAQRQPDLFIDAPVPVHPVETEMADLFAELEATE